MSNKGVWLATVLLLIWFWISVIAMVWSFIA